MKITRWEFLFHLSSACSRILLFEWFALGNSIILAFSGNHWLSRKSEATMTEMLVSPGIDFKLYLSLACCFHIFFFAVSITSH